MPRLIIAGYVLQIAGRGDFLGRWAAPVNPVLNRVKSLDLSLNNLELVMLLSVLSQQYFHKLDDVFE